MDMNARGRKLAERMLGLRANGGQSSELTITRKSVASYNPVTGVDTYVTQTWTGSGFKTTLNTTRAGQTNVLEGDVRFLVSPILQDTSDCPSLIVGDVITHSGVKWVVIDAMEYAPAGLLLYQDVHARKQVVV